MLSILAVILGLGLLIGIHEASHMFVSKAFGVRVLKFSFGFGPLLLSHMFRGTSYELRLLPLGGFVQMEGDNPTNLVPGGFFTLPWYKRALIALAGPIASLALGVLILFVILIGLHGWPLLEGLVKAFQMSFTVITETLRGLSTLFASKANVSQLSGPVMITKVMVASFKSGMTNFLLVLSIISTSLGLFNLFPIPGLDGGHVFLYVLEGILGKRFSERVYTYWSALGLVLLISLMLFTVWLDIAKL